MAKESSIACSLEGNELNERLAAIAEIGSDSLIEHDLHGTEHRLRFRSDEATRGRLDRIVAAEAECCSFLDLSLKEEAGELVLSVSAPTGAQALADGLAAAFGAGAGGGRDRSGG